MSIQTELARIKGAKADLQSWVEKNGVTVPDGTLIDGLVELAKTVETGGGGSDTQIDALIDRSITEISNSRVTKIGKYVFRQCPSLTTADFPAATSIGGYAFAFCSSLTTVDFPAATSIGMGSFQECSSLTTADFPAATSIDDNAFAYCSSLTTVDFPAATSIGTNTFAYCSSLTKFILRNPDAVCTLSSAGTFVSTPIDSKTGYIYVPSALLNRYKAATNWSTLKDQIRAIEDYPDITGGAA